MVWLKYNFLGKTLIILNFIADWCSRRPGLLLWVQRNASNSEHGVDPRNVSRFLLKGFLEPLAVIHEGAWFWPRQTTGSKGWNPTKNRTGKGKTNWFQGFEIWLLHNDYVRDKGLAIRLALDLSSLLLTNLLCWDPQDHIPTHTIERRVLSTLR